MGISGKSDFEDFCTMHHTPADILEKYQIYSSSDAIIPLKITSEKDLVAFYPYLIISMYSNQKEGGVIRLASEPYIDIEEQEHIKWQLDELIKYYKRCKRRKESFDKEEALNKISWKYWNGDIEPQQYEIELVNRVSEFGLKATIENLHDQMHDRMRDKWYQMMTKKGWNEDVAYRWVYGWHRFFEKLKDERRDKIKTDDNNSKN